MDIGKASEKLKSPNLDLEGITRESLDARHVRGKIRFVALLFGMHLRNFPFD